MKQTQERIKADAEKQFPCTIKNSPLHVKAVEHQRIGYIAGATAENERAQVLVDALEIVLRSWDEAKLNAVRRDKKVYVDPADIAIAKERLLQWKRKEVENVCTCSLQQLYAHGECYKCPGQHTRHKITNPQK